MKTVSLEAQAALASGQVVTSGAVWFGGAEPAGFWGGFGEIVIDGEVYVGVGDRGLIEVSAGTLGGTAQGATLSLSGVDPDVAARLDLKALRGVPVVIHRLIFNGAGSRLLDATVFLRGRVDSAPENDTPGGTAVIEIGIEGAARGLGRRGERMRTDADQRLIAPNDGSFRRVSYAGEKTITWGGRPSERAGVAVGGTRPVTPGAGSGGTVGGGTTTQRDVLV